MNPYIKGDLGEDAGLSHPVLKIVEESCWIWKGRKTKAGYGQMTVRGREQYVHRFEYESRVGPIPKGLVLDHLCRNRACYRPDHLEPVTHAENMRRARREICRNGHPRTAGNTYTTPTGQRQCRDCNRAWKKQLVNHLGEAYRGRPKVKRQRRPHPKTIIAYAPNIPYIPPGQCQCGCGKETGVARHAITKKGIAKGQPLRYRHGHSGSRYEIGAYQIDETTGCWIWRRSASLNGYGQVYYMGRLYRAHRLFYELFREPIPEDLEIHHECEQKLCVNPAHLRPVTRLENVRAIRRKQGPA